MDILFPYQPEGLPIDDGQELTPVNFINNGDVRTVDMDSFISIRRENIVPDSYRMYFHVTGNPRAVLIKLFESEIDFDLRHLYEQSIQNLA